MMPSMKITLSQIRPYYLLNWQLMTAPFEMGQLNVAIINSELQSDAATGLIHGSDPGYIQCSLSALIFTAESSFIHCSSICRLLPFFSERPVVES